jgi:hypothetical protein
VKLKLEIGNKNGQKTLIRYNYEKYSLFTFYIIHDN